MPFKIYIACQLSTNFADSADLFEQEMHQTNHCVHGANCEKRWQALECRLACRFDNGVGVKKINWMVLMVLTVLAAMVQADEQAELTATLNNFHQAAANADMDSYFAVMTDDVVFLGTDGSERWQGQDFRDFVQSNFSDGRGWTYHSVQRNVVRAADGQTAWFDETLQNDGLGKCRGSGVLVKSGGEWKIAQYNLSVPVPNALVHDVVSDIAALDTPVQTAAQSAGTAAGAPVASAITAEAAVGDEAIAEPSAAPQPEAQQERSGCTRKRWKTNRKAGC
jgi:ketosteroid isomerase-like protein